jgi:hypothetical protein
MIDRSAALKIASAIQVQEGWYPGSLSYRNNNPGNLRFVGQPGAVLGDGGFAKFATPDAGLEATVAQIERNATRGTDAAGRPVATVGDLIYSWAPPNENNTAAYVSSIERQTGFASSDLLSSLASPGVTGSFDGTADEPGTVAGLNLPASALAAVGVIGASLLWLAVRS